jgi:hypothetical protein
MDFCRSEYCTVPSKARTSYVSVDVFTTVGTCPCEFTLIVLYKSSFSNIKYKLSGGDGAVLFLLFLKNENILIIFNLCNL